MILAKSPYRISFLGGGCDIPVWYKEYGGRFLGAAINKYVYVTIRDLPPFFEDHTTRVVYSRDELVFNNWDIAHPAVRACLQYYNITNGLEIHYDGDLPSRSGVGSSSSFILALLSGLHYYKTSKILDSFDDKFTLASTAIELERSFMLESGGIQDQILSALGGINYVEINPQDELKIYPVDLNFGGQILYNKLSQYLGLFFVGGFRESHIISREWEKQLEINRLAFSELYNITLEGFEYLAKEKFFAFGKLLSESWKIKSKISVVSNPKLDDIYSIIMVNGAIGAKVIGAGSGGFFLVFATPGAMERIKGKLNTIFIPVGFDLLGTQVIRV